MKLLTYNIYCGMSVDGTYSVEKQANLVASFSPDIVCLQEVEVNQKQQRTRSFSVEHADDQLAIFAKILGMKHRTFLGKYIESSEYFQPNGEWGLGVLSRFPIVETRVIPFSAVESACDYCICCGWPWSLFRSKKPMRGLGVKLSISPNVTIWVANVHLKPKYNNVQVVHVSEVVKAFEGDRGSPLILCGDLNSPQMCGIHRDVIAQAGFEDVGPFSGTWPSRRLPKKCFCCAEMLRIDYIYLRNPIKVKANDSLLVAKSSSVIRSEFSDHLPVLAEFDLVEG